MRIWPYPRKDDTTDQVRKFVQEVWRLALGRTPENADLNYLVQRLVAGDSPIDYLLEVAACPEATARRARQDAAAPLFVEPGHYYSPVVNPIQLRSSSFERRRAADRLLAVNLDLATMEVMFEHLMKHQAGLAFPRHAIASHRYYSDNDIYGIGDAMILACMVRHFRSRQVIEVGSGFSSAVLLDTLDRTPDLSTACTFIEPYTDRLDGLLRPSDLAHTTILRVGVQEVSEDIFGTLERGDILFLDTTHISKTNSDVNHEIFEILPRLSSGVVIHFHDIFADFDYPADWIYDQNRSWNEQYVLRAFLMYNQSFEIIYANDAFAAAKSELVMEKCPQILENRGAGLWLQKK